MKGIRMQNKYIETPIQLMTEFSDSSGNSNVTYVDSVQNIFALIPGSSHNGNRRDPNPWSYNLYEYKTSGGFFSETYDDGVYSYRSRSDVRPLLTPDLGLDSALRQADEKAMEKLYNLVRGDLDVSVDAFQARQTAKMFSLSDQFRNMFRRRVSVLNKAGSAWLQYVYGWKPLASTIYGVANESMRFANNYVQNFTASGSVRVNHSVKDLIPIGGDSFPGVYKYTGDARVRYGCRFLLDDGTDYRRFSSLNPLSIAWELLPWSFVVDWAFNVGSYLRHAESALLYGSNFQSGYKTTTAAVTINWRGGGSKKSGPRTYSGAASGSYRNISVHREILSTTPYPRPPRVDLELGSGRLLNAAALLSQFITSAPTRSRGPRQFGSYTE